VKKSTKRWITIFTAALITAATAFVIVRLISPPRDLRGALAAALHVPASRDQDFFINLPPAGSRYPGAILVVPQMLVLEQSTANDNGITEGTHFTLVASDSIVADALSSFSSTVLSTAGRDKKDVEVALKVSDGRVLEMPVADLKRRLLSSQSAQSAANKGTDPVVISRAYSGILTFTLRQKSSAGARVIANVAKAPELNANGSVKLDASKSGEGEITIEVAQPVVFAFEASSARYITNHLGSGPNDVTLTPIKPSDVKAPPNTAAVSAEPWTVASISSGYYQHIRTNDQPWNSRSADAVESAFQLFNPQSTLRVRATSENPLTSSALNDFVAQIGAAAKQAHSQFILVYYIGHSLSWPNGDIALVLGEAEQIPEPKREYTNEAISERVGAKVGALFQLADALYANLEKLPPGYMPLRDLYSELDKIGIPFVLLVDGCLRNDEFEQFRNSIGLTTDSETRSFFYTGPDGKLLSSLDGFDQRLRHFADSLPYLRSRNLVILAAKPGTFAQPWPDPDLDWSQVGPLSARITNYVRASAWDQDPPTLGDVLSNVTDYKGTGEISPKGSISWSDFDSVKKLTDEFKLQTTRRASKQTGSDAPVNGD
jgi:hypothetical protein